MKQEQAAQNHKALSGEPMPDLEQQLFELGVPIGERILELMFARELGKNLNVSATGKRETGIVNMLHFINQQVWKGLFGRPGDDIKQNDKDDCEYWIIDKRPVTNLFTSVGQTGTTEGPNCAFFIAGIIQGILTSSKMFCKVTAVRHKIADETPQAMANPYEQRQQDADATIYVIKFAQEVCDRDATLT
jgi:Transport protein particle (TRAPP) component